MLKIESIRLHGEAYKIEHEYETMIDSVKMQDVGEKLNAYSLGLINYLDFLEKISTIPALSHVNEKFAQLLVNVVSKIMKARDRL